MFSLNENFLQHIDLPTDSKITRYHRVGGGDINQAYSLETETGEHYFLKVQPNSVAAFFQHEADGLKLLAQAVRVPRVLGMGQVKKDQWLLLESLNAVNDGDQYALGRALAKVHAITSPNQEFGFDRDFTAGKTAKINHWQKDWYSFFVEQRLAVLRGLLLQEGKWVVSDADYEQAVNKFKLLLTDHVSQPSLLHGDFWSGNFMFDADSGEPIFIDPDVYYGDAEFDLGITTVFGGFNRDFYAGYQSLRPFDAGIDQRLMFYQLYYLMVHAHLFAGSYIQAYAGKLSQIIGH
ncbi:fructosamine kinase family protein [Oenococcus sicerae]|uniref:fructosamine kinase family protein n=1 Tax=Oenococcus sicerae TaxID=2203724 RepID=UPI0010BC645C|nr:hypothetical protein OAL24_01377 [Oenococcus sicerae]